MINIDRHIEILLLDNDCVIVPGLGGFIAHHVSAHYDEETNTYLPPIRTLGFNRQLQINDSLLAQSYIETYDISYPEAIRRIEEESNQLMQELRSEGEYELHGLGTLRLDAGGKILFEPYESGTLTPQLYGLSTIDIMPLIQPKKKEQTLNLTPQTHTPESDEPEEEEKTITIRVSTLKYALATAAAVIFLVAFAIPFGLSERSDLIISSIDTSILNNLINKKEAPKPQIKQEVKKEIKQETKISKEIKKDTTAVVVKAETPEKIFSLVLASRVSKRNATAFVERLKQQGVDARVIKRTRGCQVVTGNYKSKDEALKALRTYRSDYTVFEDSWITVI